MHEIPDNARRASTPSVQRLLQAFARLALLAAAQSGVAATWQLLDLGFSPDQISLLVVRGHLHRIHRGVYAVGHTALSRRGRWIAALLAAGCHAFLSHRTAAAVRGIAATPRTIEVTVPGLRTPRRRDGLWLHRTRHEPDPADVERRDGMRVSSVPRMLVELAGRESPRELERLVTASVQKRLLLLDTPSGIAELEAALERHPRYPGARRLAAVLAGYRRTEDLKSNLERSFRRMLRREPDIPAPAHNVFIGGWEIDVHWPAAKLCIELDGRPCHVAVADMERDRMKDAALLKLGQIPIRITDFRLEHDRAGVLADVRHFLGGGDRLR